MAYRKIDLKNFVEVHEGVRIGTKDMTPGLHYYQCRHAEMDWAFPVTIEKYVMVNFWGTIATKEPVALNCDGFRNLSKLDGERITLHGLKFNRRSRERR